MNGQLTDEDLGDMTPEEINAARRAGRLDELMGRPVEIEPDDDEPEARFSGSADAGARDGQPRNYWDESELAHMTPAQINQARRAGQLDHLLNP